MCANIYKTHDALPNVTLIGFIYNKSYGGYDYSELALNEYTKRTGKSLKMGCLGYGGESRYDPVMINIVLELGKKANGPYSSLGVKYIDPKYINYINIKEYDGKETVYIDYDRYFFDSVARIVEMDESSDHKVDLIKSEIIHFKSGSGSKQSQ